MVHLGWHENSGDVFEVVDASKDMQAIGGRQEGSTLPKTNNESGPSQKSRLPVRDLYIDSGQF